MIDPGIATQIAVAARVLAHAGLTAALGNHLSVAHEGNMHVNAFGTPLAALRPTDVVVTDFDGNVLAGAGAVNETILLHGLLHRLVPSARALVHTHSPKVLTLGALRVVPEVYDQESCLLAGDVVLHEEAYGGLASRSDRVAPLAELLGRANAVMLPNHGSLTTGEDLFLATLRMLRLEAMAARHLEVHAGAVALGRPARAIDPEVAAQARAQMAGIAQRFSVADLYWRAWTEQLKKTDPDLFE